MDMYQREKMTNLVEDLICSQKVKQGSHFSPREIEKLAGISPSSVTRLVKKHLV